MAMLVNFIYKYQYTGIHYNTDYTTIRHYTQFSVAYKKRNKKEKKKKNSIAFLSFYFDISFLLSPFLSLFNLSVFSYLHIFLFFCAIRTGETICYEHTVQNLITTIIAFECFFFSVGVVVIYFSEWIQTQKG